MTHRAIASALFALLAATLAAGCSSAPADDARAGATHEAIIVNKCDWDPFLSEVCYQPPTGHPVCSLQCFTQPATPDPNAVSGLPPAATSVATPAELANKGCSHGLFIGCANVNAWICPGDIASTFADGKLPAQFGSTPLCGPGLARGTPCEQVLSSTTVPDNALFGNPNAGKILIEEVFSLYDESDEGGGCSGGCARLSP